MAFDSVAADALSNNFRVSFLALDSESRQQAIASFLEATSVKSERNVRTWFSVGSDYRKILNRSLSADEYALREKLVKALIGANNVNVPLKTASSVSTRKANAQKFAKYAKDSYTGRFVRAISFDRNGFTFSYDVYGFESTLDDGLDDEDLIEFEDAV